MARRKRESFSDLYGRMHPAIRRIARNQYVPGLDHDDVEAEMLACLWKAHRTLRPGGVIETYWWSVWLNRRADLIEKWNAAKRIDKYVKYVDLLPEFTIDDHHYPQPPSTEHPLASFVWWMLASGFVRSEVVETLRISRRTYYAIIDALRTDDTYESLKGVPIEKDS